MDDRGTSPEKAVSTAAAAAARRGMLPFFLAFLAGCFTPERTPYTLADLRDASIPGYHDIRFFADMPQDELAAQRTRFLPEGSGADGRSTWLVLSSGGAGGAFGAGVLAGWSERGDRPQFDLVTGVSAGALLAPFAFVGPAADTELANLFTALSVKQINHSRSLLAGVLGQGAISRKTFRALIEAHVNKDLVDRIAARHRTGARLLAVTTNLDSQRSVVWDIGAIAASGRPDSVRLIGDVLEASASIPAIFPPVRIPVTGDRATFEELHADGGVIRQLYLLPDAFYSNADLDGLRPDIYVIVNAALAPRFSVIPQQSIRIAERALSSLEKSSATQSVTEMAQFARQNRATFRLAYIDRAIPANRHIPFDPGFMRDAFALGQAKGRAGAWEFGPPIGTDLLAVE
ncbi:MAG: patatin-like phospholipase family protein [Rhodobacteraceae bacterium]|nr:patatin-like phospholipase family protein [Paracoccaceae bacterium]MCP5341773.1 patatin-like phospholipase family protein [Paracoccaceae bacterium]